MEIIKQSKKAVTIELSPIELELLRSAVGRERAYRSKTWSKVEPKFPEELLYHAVMKQSIDEISTTVSRAVQRYRNWGILK